MNYVWKGGANGRIPWLNCNCRAFQRPALILGVFARQFPEETLECLDLLAPLDGFLEADVNLRERVIRPLATADW